MSGDRLAVASRPQKEPSRKFARCPLAESSTAGSSMLVIAPLPGTAIRVESHVSHRKQTSAASSTRNVLISVFRAFISPRGTGVVHADR